MLALPLTVVPAAPRPPLHSTWGHGALALQDLSSAYHGYGMVSGRL